jgi:hypothetical protein
MSSAPQKREPYRPLDRTTSKEMIIKDKKLKKQLDKIPDADKNGDPIFKIANAEKNKNQTRKDRAAKWTRRVRPSCLLNSPT